MQHRRFLVGAAAVAAVGGDVTYVLASKNVQHTTTALWPASLRGAASAWHGAEDSARLGCRDSGRRSIR
ncbi:hypothetical protein ABZ519_41570 [Streptomyces collinus]|uniref:hypothetical protein n=1 Tax=Streptomyces TaxID=1883 RepID=UPI0033D1E026